MEARYDSSGLRAGRALAGTLVVAALAMPAAAIAQGLSYNYVQARYLTVDLDDSSIDFDGFGAKVSGLVADSVYVLASYDSLHSDRLSGGPLGGSGRFRSKTITAGLGLRAPIAPYTDFNAEAAYVYSEIEGSGAFSAVDEDDDGYGLGIGLRHLLVPQFEVGVAFDYVDFGRDNDDISFTLSALGHLTPQFSLGAGFTRGEDAKSWTVGLRFNF